ncbi:MAG: hypothetical protein KDK12_04000 [Rhodobacteraceae bacterium]|nr:hypothetical protein [Paracoccaceae bacterium]
MIRIALAMFLLAGPAGALSMPGFEGSWQGEGTLALGDEPVQRFRCRIRLNETRPGESVFQGRCATAQASQSFTYLLREDPDGTLRGENRASAEDDLPATLRGRAEADLLHLEGGDGGLFELRREGATLHFRIEGHDDRGPARGTAVLQLRD